MLNSNFHNVGAVVLAAGKGTRLNCVDKPKVMCEIGGKPIISYIVSTFAEIGFAKNQVVLVVGFCKEKIKEYIGDQVVYADQQEQKGTAHAAYTGSLALPNSCDTILVINGDDSAFYTKETISSFIENHQKNQAVLSVLSAELSDPSLYGRVIKHDTGVVEIIEKEYLTDEQKKVKEISTGTFCLNKKWFEEVFSHMPPLRKLGEYGLPTAVAMAVQGGKKVYVEKLKNNEEWFGINTPPELAEADYRKNNSRSVLS